MTKRKHDNANDAEAEPDVGAWLNSTGFAVEAETARRIHRHGYFQVKAPEHYADLDGETVKELDVLAWRRDDAKRLWHHPRIGELQGRFRQDTLAQRFSMAMTVSLRIECKYAVQPWVVFSAQAEHATGESMVWNFLASEVAETLQARLNNDATPETVPLLINGGIMGRSLRQAKVKTDGKLPSNTDDCYKALMSALVSSKHAMGTRDEDEDEVEITLPVIVIKGMHLYNASTDADFELSHAQIGRARVLYKLPNDLSSDLAVDVVHLDDLDAYIDAAKRTAEGIFDMRAEMIIESLFKQANDVSARQHGLPGGSGWAG